MLRQRSEGVGAKGTCTFPSFSPPKGLIQTQHQMPSNVSEPSVIGHGSLCMRPVCQSCLTCLISAPPPPPLACPLPLRFTTLERSCLSVLAALICPDAIPASSAASLTSSWRSMAGALERRQWFDLPLAPPPPPRCALRAVTATTRSKSPRDFKPLLRPTPSASPQTPNRAQILGTQ